MSPPCRAQYLKIIRALLVQRDTDNCCSKFFLADRLELPLLAVVRSAMMLIDFRAKGDQTPNVSTTSGINSHPASSTVSQCLWSFANSPAVAATPAQEEEEGICKAWVVLRTDKSK